MSRTSSLVLPLARWTLVMLAIALAGYWTWRQPWMQASAEAWRLARLPAPTALPVPVEGVRARHIADTWGGARSGGGCSSARQAGG